MLHTEEKYISLLTDFGFKRIFGTKPNKSLLISFLNSLFDGEQVIKNVKYLNSEHVGDVFTERKAIFDVYCENEKGEKFIVEMQNAYQTFFKDRSLYYSTFPIREQAPKGDEWNFKLEHVYVVALLNFDIKEDAFDENSINHDVGLLDKKTHKVFNNKLTFKYVEIAKFSKKVDQLHTLYDKWLFILKNLSRLDSQPERLRNEVFNRLFKEAEIAQFNKAELKEYEDSLKAYRDIKNSLDSAEEKGFQRGIAEGKIQGIAEGKIQGIAEGKMQGIAEKAKSIATKLKQAGMPIKEIASITGLSIEEIQNS